MVALLPCRCRLDASVAPCGGTEVAFSLEWTLWDMSYPSVPTKEQTTADSVCFSVRYRAIAGPLVRLVLAPGSSGIDSVSDPGPGSSGASFISTPGSGSGCDSCSGSESGSVNDFGSMLILA